MEDKELREIMKNPFILEYVDEPDEISLAEEQNYDLKDPKSVGVLPIIPISKVAALALQGLKTSEIAEHLDVSCAKIRKIKGNEEYKNIVSTMTHAIVEQSKDFIKTASVKATMTLVESLDSSSDKIRLSAAQDILNRSGVKQADTLNIIARSDSTANMTEDELKGIIKLGHNEIMIEEKANESTDDSEC